MGEPRVNQSSIRYSNKVKEIIENAKGDTFGDKFEYVTVHYEETKELLERELKSIQKKIEQEKEILNNLLRNINQIRDMSLNIELINKTIDKVKKNIDVYNN